MPKPLAQDCAGEPLWQTRLAIARQDGTPLPTGHTEPQETGNYQTSVGHTSPKQGFPNDWREAGSSEVPPLSHPHTEGRTTPNATTPTRKNTTADPRAGGGKSQSGAGLRDAAHNRNQKRVIGFEPTTFTLAT